MIEPFSEHCESCGRPWLTLATIRTAGAQPREVMAAHDCDGVGVLSQACLEPDGTYRFRTIDTESAFDVLVAARALLDMIDTHRRVYEYEKAHYVIDEGPEWAALRVALGFEETPEGVGGGVGGDGGFMWIGKNAGVIRAKGREGGQPK